MVIEQDGVREPAGLLKLPFGLACLQLSHHDSTDQRQRHQRRRRCACFVPTQELSGPVIERVRASVDGPVFQIAKNLIAELARAAIATLRILGQRAAKNRV